MRVRPLDQALLATYAAGSCGVPSGDGASPPPTGSGWPLPRLVTRGRRQRDRRRRRRSRAVHRAARPCGTALPLAAPCVHGADDAHAPRRRDPAPEPVTGHPVPPRLLRAAVQRSLESVRPSLRRPLPLEADHRRALLLGGVPVRSRQPRRRGPVRPAGRVSVERRTSAQRPHRPAAAGRHKLS